MPIRSFIRGFAAVALSFCLLGFCHAQESDPDPFGQVNSADGIGNDIQHMDEKGGEKGRKPGDLRAYKDVVTADAKSQTGLFKVHQIDDRILWEIPANLLGRDLLWQVELAEISSSMPYDYPGEALDAKVFRFTRHGNKLFMRLPVYTMKAVDGSDMQTGVEASSVVPISATFDILTEGPDKAPVIDVTSLYMPGMADFTVPDKIGAQGLDPSRSYIDRISDFPTNIETSTVMSLMGYQGARGPSTVTVHTSVVLLPETPMMGRYADSRVGYFSTPFELYGSSKNKVEVKSFIQRYRLEKKDPKSILSEPKQPIVFYISREVPEKWRPWIQKGIEAWNEAFQQAGFTNVMVAKNAPTKEENPTWDPEDARYNVVRWAPSPIENAMGPHVYDPRSGEVLSAHVIIWHNILDLVQDWYYAQAGATDPRAARLPLPDDVMGPLVQYVVTHEIGHTLGLAHNMRASNAYTVAQLRDPNFVKANGLSASVMDYARFNYVAQPGDNATEVGRLGAYDRFAIEWGYKPDADAKNPEDESAFLDQIAARQVNDRTLRFADDMAAYQGIDPQSQTEDLSDDPIEATRLGLLNIRRIAASVIPASTKLGEDYGDLDEAWYSLEVQRLEELLHVTAVVGGVEETDFHAGRGGAVYTPVPKDRQRQAVTFLLANMATPPELMNPEVLNRIQNFGTLDYDKFVQLYVLYSLFQPQRVSRLFENAVMNGPTAYSPSAFLDDVTAGVWPDLYGKTRGTYFKREGQRTYLDILDYYVNGTPERSEFRLLAELELKQLANRLDKAIATSGSDLEKVHYQDSRDYVSLILDGKTAYALHSGSAMFQALVQFGGDYATTANRKGIVNCFVSPVKAVFDAWRADPEGFQKKFGLAPVGE